MHRLLQRQLKRHIGLVENIPQDWQSFVDAVNETYHQADADRALLERSLDLTSQELLEKNQQLGQQIVEQERAREELEAILARTGILYDISHSLSAAKDENEMLQILARPAIEAGVNSVHLLYFDLDEVGEPVWAEIVTDWYREGEPLMPIGSRFYLPELPFAKRWVASPDETQLITDTGDDQVDEKTKRWFTPSGGRALVTVPLRQVGRWVGMIVFAWDEPREFSEREAEVYNALIDLASLAVASRRQFEQAQARVRREQILREITSRVRSFTDPDAVVRAAVRELGTALGRPTFVRLGGAEELSQTPAAWTDSGDGGDMA
jgi:transcriptional regulator with GAF, ATPase, and Fis domain